MSWDWEPSLLIGLRFAVGGFNYVVECIVDLDQIVASPSSLLYTYFAFLLNATPCPFLYSN
jgi:hypothetical protein